MSKIRILHTLETIGSGGVEQLRYLLAKGLDKIEFEQRIVCTQALGVLPDRLRAEGMDVMPVGLLQSPFQLSRYQSVIRIIKAYKPHIIHGAVFEGISLGVVAGRITRVPGIIIEETSDPVDRSWKGNALMRLYAGFSDRVIAASEAAGDYVRTVVHIREPKLQVVNNGVAEPEQPTPIQIERLKADLGIRPHDFVIGSVGRLFDDHKKFSDLIKAVARLKERQIPVKLLIIGDGQDRANLEALASELGLQSSVIFAGYQGDTAPYFALMNLFALASQREAFGLVLVEAMFFKLPVVATAVGGIKYVVEDGQTGRLVEKNNPSALAEAIEDLYKDPLKRSLYGDAGWKRAKAHFTAETYVEKIRKVYLELATQKGISI